MKINRKKILKPLVKLHFLKNQFYKQFFNFQSTTNTVTLQLKQALKTIYLYEKKKKILFLGFSYNKLVHNQTNHYFRSKTMYLKNKLGFDKFDLIVFNKSSYKDLQLLKILDKSNIPVIVFGGFGEKVYNVSILTKKKSIKNFNLFLIFSILTKYQK